MKFKSVYIPKNLIETSLTNAPLKGKNLLEPLKSFSSLNDVPLNILEDTDVSNEAEVHLEEGDLWHCLEGEATFIYGGSLINGLPKKKSDGTLDYNELRSAEIINGIETVLKIGDWLWIPAGEPHLHKSKGTSRLLIIKIPAKKEE